LISLSGLSKEESMVTKGGECIFYDNLLMESLDLHLQLHFGTRTKKRAALWTFIGCRNRKQY
jgi:hypothetical protein